MAETKYPTRYILLVMHSGTTLAAFDHYYYLWLFLVLCKSLAFQIHIRFHSKKHVREQVYFPLFTSATPDQNKGTSLGCAASTSFICSFIFSWTTFTKVNTIYQEKKVKMWLVQISSSNNKLSLPRKVQKEHNIAHKSTTTQPS